VFFLTRFVELAHVFLFYYFFSIYLLPPPPPSCFYNKTTRRYRRSTHAAWPYTGLMGSTRDDSQDTLLAFELPSARDFGYKIDSEF
jgi:hypothetical protein